MAARRLFVEQGYHRVSIPDIVNVSGVSTGAIYNHFQSKENLARVTHELTLDEFNARLQARLADGQSAFQMLKAFVDLLLEIAEQDPVMMEYMLFMRHGEFLTDIRPICFSEPFRWVQRTIGEGMARGELRRGVLLLAAGAFTGAVLRNIELKLNGVFQGSLQAASRQIMDQAWRTICA
ncbi:hypothetical protein DESUT3_31480 [Desulfuromonas versatilis]|uniref:HTH tetR-type domain-containing protein n=2 Tax=Desulfuromonas versatilis TaxID=2802975 RepID=A0ABM8HY99_9BACT|nr:hypothetical protein DESUT3_31480 [Desulfuromonas versatilis]